MQTIFYGIGYKKPILNFSLNVVLYNFLHEPDTGGEVPLLYEAWEGV